MMGAFAAFLLGLSFGFGAAIGALALAWAWASFLDWRGERD